MADVRSDLASGDAVKQTSALMTLCTAVASGRDTGAAISTAIQAILASPSAAPVPRHITYDLVLASPSLSDVDWARVAAAVGQDLQRGVAPEVRAKALDVLPTLPAHRLAALLEDPQLVLVRLVAALRSPTDALRAAAVGAVAGLAERPEVASQAAGDAGLLGALMDLWEAVPDALIDETDLVVAAACSAVTALLSAAPGPAQSQEQPQLAEEMLVPEGERATAAGVARSLLGAVQARVHALLGVALARFATLGSVLRVAVPPLLVAYLRSLAPSSLGASEEWSGEPAPLSALPGEVVEGCEASAATCQGPAFEECAAFLVEQLHSVSPAAAMAAAEALLELSQMEGAPVSVLAALPAAAQAIIGAAAGAGGSAVSQQTPSAAAAQPRVLSLLAGSLRSVPTVQQPLLFHRLLLLVASIPQAADRVRALAKLWTAALVHDWGSGGGGGNARRGTPPQLQQLLLEPGVREVVSGLPASPTSGSSAAAAFAALADGEQGMSAIAGSALPAFREELVGSLLCVLLTHPRAAAVAAAGHGGAAAAAASGAVAQAAALQAAAEAGEWLASAKVALLGTKACLGWDRMAGASTTGTTAALRAHDASARAEDGTAATSQQQQPTTLQVAQATARRKAAALEMDMQGLLLQIATNWRALHPAVRPRAIWLCCCHLQLKSVPDGGWNSVIDAIRGLLMESRKSDAAHYGPAVAEGALALPPAATASSSGAVPGQAAEVALLCLERLASLVAHNAAVGGRELAVQLAPVAGLLERLVRLEQEGSQQGGPALCERLARVSATLLPVATGGKKQDKQASAKWTGRSRHTVQDGVPTADAGGEQQAAPVVKDLLAPPSEPASAAYPLTLPSATALFGTPTAHRYRCFLGQLQAAVWGTDSAALGGASTAPASDSGRAAGAGGLPALMDLVQILGGRVGAAAGTEVTGTSTPVSLAIAHVADPARRVIRLQCRVLNRTIEEIRGVEVELTAGGPLAAGCRRPLVFKLEPLPPAEGTSWEASLRVAGFGWPTVQASLRLPVKVPSGEPVMRCRPYTISPLQLLAPPARPPSPAEFYQQWQCLPHRAMLTGVAAAGAGPAADGAALRVLQGIEAAAAAGLCCVHRATAPAGGASFAAFHGTSWEGQAVGVIVVAGPAAPTVGDAGGGEGEGRAGLAAAAAALGAPSRLHFFFRSEAPEMIAHLRGHQAELLDQLTGGLVVAAASEGEEDATEPVAAAPELPARQPAAYSFLRTYTSREEELVGGAEEEGAEGEDAAGSGAFAVENAAVAQWQRLRAQLAA
eukprot:scaffold17.g480.t1